MSKYERDCPFFNRTYRRRDLLAGGVSGILVGQNGKIIVQVTSGPFAQEVEINCLACGVKKEVLCGNSRTPETARLYANEKIEIFKRENDKNCRLRDIPILNS
jgi:hypothetical protein